MDKLTQDAKKAAAAYMREWRRHNPEKVREYRRRQWEKKGAEMRKQIEEEKAARNELF